MNRTKTAMRTAVALGLLLAWTGGARAQITVDVKKDVLIILDTSGSMNYCGSCQVAWGECTTEGLAKGDCGCGVTSSWGRDRPCRLGLDGSLSDCPECLAKRIDVVKDVLVGSCNEADDNADDGILDDYANDLRVGLGTYDDKDDPSPYSYWTNTYGIKGRGTFNGALIDVVNPDDPDGILAHNAVVQKGICEANLDTYTPIAAAIDDALFYFGGYGSNGDYGSMDPEYIDPAAACRPKYVILLTDGKQSRPETAVPADSAAALCSAGITLFVIGFGGAPELSDSLNSIAQAGTGSACFNEQLDAFMATDPTSLRVKFNDVMKAIMTGTASITMPVSSPASNLASYGSSYQFLAFFEVGEVTTDWTGWEGHLVRQRIELDGDGMPVILGDPLVPDGDKVISFDAILASRTAADRNLYTVLQDARSTSFVPPAGVLVDDTNYNLPRPLHETDPFVGLFPFKNMSGSDDSATILPGDVESHVCASLLKDSSFENNNDEVAAIKDYMRGVPGTAAADDEKTIKHPILGDIYHSNPVLVLPPSALSPDFRYEIYFQLNKDRHSMLYVGANDGFLHAFVGEDNRDEDNVDDTGKELWAFIPNNLLSKIPKVRYGRVPFVDGTPVVRDVFFPLLNTPDPTLVDPDAPHDPDNCLKSGGVCLKGAYRTVLISGEGAGGNAYFALDVTEPEYPAYLWEYRPDVAPDVDYSSFQCTNTVVETRAKPIVGRVWLKDANSPPAEPRYLAKSVAIVPGGYWPPGEIGKEFLSCMEFVKWLSSTATLHVLDVETGKLMKKFTFGDSGSDWNQDMIDCYDYLSACAAGDADACTQAQAAPNCVQGNINPNQEVDWAATFFSGSEPVPNGWGWGNNNTVPPDDAFWCREARDDVAGTLVLPPEWGCHIITDSPELLLKRCCPLDAPGEDADCQGIGTCYYSYRLEKDPSSPLGGSVIVKFKGDNCKDLPEANQGYFALQVGKDFWAETMAATPTAYNTTLGEFMSRLFLGSTRGNIYRVDLGTALYDETAPQGEMISPNEVGDIVHDWTVTMWYDTGSSNMIMNPLVLAKNYDRKLMLFFSNGNTDDLEYYPNAPTYSMFVLTENMVVEDNFWIPDTTAPLESGIYVHNFTNPGERVVGKPLVVAGLVFFVTFTPEGTGCGIGTSRLYKWKFFDKEGDPFPSPEVLEDTEGSVSPPTLLWTPAGAMLVTQKAGGKVEEVETGGAFEPASHTLHWGKVL